MVTTDNREHRGRYEMPEPWLSAPQSAVLNALHAFSDSIEVHVVSCSKRPMARPEKLGPNIWFHQPIVPGLGWGRSAFAGCAMATRKLASKLDVQLAHGQGTERECAVSAVHSGVPSVVTIHGHMEKLNRDGQAFKSAKLYGRLISGLENHALGRARGVFCNSSYTEKLVAHRTPRTWLVPNPIQLDYLESPLPPRPSGIPQIVNVGFLSPWKRQLELLEELIKLRSLGLEFRIVFAGQASQESAYGKAFFELLKKCERDGFASHVGYLSSPEIMKLMDESHAMIHCPSEEAFGLAAGEAMARGLKFFGTMTGGLLDVATGVPGAELHPNIAILVQSVAVWLRNGAERNHGAPAIIRDRYHPSVIAARHVEIYSEILEVEASTT